MQLLQKTKPIQIPAHEQFSVTKVSIDNNKFNITVQNSGNIPINITRIWVQNTTNVPWGTAKYDILKNNGTVYPGHTLYNIGQKITPANTFNSTVGYDIKLVTSRGNTKEFFVNSARNSPVYLQLFALPASGGPNSFNTTLLFAVTNNMTNGGALFQHSTQYDSHQHNSYKRYEFQDHHHLFIRFYKMETLHYFKWQYKIKGTNGQKVNFKPALKNGYLANFVSQDVTLTNVTSGRNIGQGGTGIYAGTSANNLKFKNVTAGAGITITSNLQISQYIVREEVLQGLQVPQEPLGQMVQQEPQIQQQFFLVVEKPQCQPVLQRLTSLTTVLQPLLRMHNI